MSDTKKMLWPQQSHLLIDSLAKLMGHVYKPIKKTHLPNGNVNEPQAKMQQNCDDNVTEWATEDVMEDVMEDATEGA